MDNLVKVEIWVFRKFTSLAECSQIREQSRVVGVSILRGLWKLKAKKIYWKQPERNDTLPIKEHPSQMTADFLECGKTDTVIYSLWNYWFDQYM